MAFFSEVSIDPSLVSLFSRLRVAPEKTVVQIRQDSQLKDLLISEGQASGSGTSSSFNALDSSTTLTVGTTPGLRRLKSRAPGLYVAGNSLLGFMTFNFLTTGQSGVVKRVGYIFINDGVYLKQENGVLSFVIRSGVTGTLIEETITQANWNEDRFDGTQDGYNLDQTKAHIFWFSLEWLGAGIVKFGFVDNGVLRTAHTRLAANVNPTSYISSPNLFPMYEIERTNVGGTPESLKTLCATVKTEGDLSNQGSYYTIELNNPYTTGAANTIFPLFIFGLGAANARVIVVNYKALIDDNTSTNVKLLLLKNPTFSGLIPFGDAQFLNNVTYINQEPGIPGSLTITNKGIVVDVALGAGGGFFSDPFSAFGTTSNAELMGTNFAYIPDIYCLAIEADTASVTVEKAAVEFWEQL